MEQILGSGFAITFPNGRADTRGDVLDGLTPGNASSPTHYTEDRRIRIAFVATARSRSDAFEKRLTHLLRMTEQGKPFGYGIEDDY